MYLDAQGNVVPNLSLDGPLSAAIPGTPAALEHLAKKYGRLPLARSLARPSGWRATVLRPMILSARCRISLRRADECTRIPGSRQTAAAGLRIKTTRTRRRINLHRKTRRPPVFIATISLKISRRRAQRGRHLDAGRSSQLQNYRTRTDPRRVPRHAHHIGAAAFVGGVALVTMLNILSGYPLATLEPAIQRHLLVEAMRRAYRDRAEYLGDPDFVSVPAKQLLHPFYAAGLRATIRLDRATTQRCIADGRAREAG